MKELIQKKLEEIVKKITDKDMEVSVSVPKDIKNGDYTSNIAFQLAKNLGKSPLEVAQQITQEFGKLAGIEKIEASTPGFINFHLSTISLSKEVENLLSLSEKVALTTKLKEKKIMVEYAHPNTHKEAHIGHTRTLMTGESIARIFEANGAKVFRANYQGDVGPHVAKAVYGISKMLEEERKTLDDFEKYNNFEKVHFLGMAYARGNADYESHKEEIDSINRLIYNKGKGNEMLWEIYQRTRTWSLSYYDDLYKLFDVKFDRLFFETEMAEEGPRIVKKYIGKVFIQDADGSVYFPGEKYGLHTRVFITKQGTPTYEGKEMANAMTEAKEFPFDLKVHVVGSEQEGYFRVVFKALELIDPQKFVGKQVHLPTGIIQLKGRKMSSRTGDVLTYNQLIDEVEENVGQLFSTKDLSEEQRYQTNDAVALGAIKYSVLKGGTRQNVTFDMEKSISLQGDSGPYIQYAYARIQSILKKAESMNIKPQLSGYYPILEDEKKVMQKLVQFVGIVENAAEGYAPNVVCEYLFELSQMFNNFYQKYKIVTSVKKEEQEFRLALTQAVGNVLKKGLYLLGIKAPERM